MSEFITFPKPSGASYIIPDVGDSNWGQNVTDFLVAIPNGTVPTSGTFTLTGDLNWGASFGLISQYYKSASSNISTAGVLRLAHSDSIGYRNNTNGANLLLTVNSSDQLLWNGSVLQTVLTLGNLTDVGTDGITVTGGTGAVVGSGTSLAQHVSDASHNGYLSSTDWSTFNNKQAALTPGSLTAAGTDGIAVTGGTNVLLSAASIAQHVADSTHNGYLSTTDWNRFNSSATGSVISVSGTANQIASTGGSTPVLSLPSAIQLPGSISVSAGDVIMKGAFSAQFWNGANTQEVIMNGGAVTAGYTLLLPPAAPTSGQIMTNSTTGGNVSLLWTSAVAQGSSGSNGIIQGTNTNDSAASGKVGEFITSSISSGSPVSLTSGGTSNVTSISLTAGDWDVYGVVGYIPAGTVSFFIQSSSLTTATTGAETGTSVTTYASGTTLSVGGLRSVIPTYRYSVASTTTVFLTASGTFASTCTAFGTISARRVR